jgi:hypothetical protein
MALTQTYSNVIVGGGSLSAASAGAHLTYSGTGGIYAGGGAGGGTWSTNAIWTSQATTPPRVNITDGDIVFDGISLRDTLKGMQERLAIMVPNPKVEREFDQLKALRDQYDALVIECEEKLKSWDILKKDDN